MQISKATWNWALWGGGGLVIASGVGVALWYFLWRTPNPNKPQIGRASTPSTGGTTSGSKLPNSGSGSAGNIWLGPSAEDALDPNYVLETERAVGSVRKLTQAKAEEHAKTIWDAWWWLDDDEDAVYEVFDTTLRDKVQVSQVAAAYESNEIAGKPLLKDLKSRLSDQEWTTVKGHIGQLPDYTPL